MVEIISPGNKSSTRAFRAFLDNTLNLIENGIHLLILDLLPPTRRDPNGIHAAIWNELIDEDDFSPPDDKPLTLAAYQSGGVVKTFVESVAVGDVLPDMSLILEPDAAVMVPLEATYQRAWDAVPRRWQVVLEPKD